MCGYKETNKQTVEYEILNSFLFFKRTKVNELCTSYLLPSKQILKPGPSAPKHKPLPHELKDPFRYLVAVVHCYPLMGWPLKEIVTHTLCQRATQFAKIFNLCVRACMQRGWMLFILSGGDWRKYEGEPARHATHKKIMSSAQQEQCLSYRISVGDNWQIQTKKPCKPNQRLPDLCRPDWTNRSQGGLRRKTKIHNMGKRRELWKQILPALKQVALYKLHVNWFPFFLFVFFQWGGQISLLMNECFQAAPLGSSAASFLEYKELVRSYSCSWCLPLESDTLCSLLLRASTPPLPRGETAQKPSLAWGRVWELTRFVLLGLRTGGSHTCWNMDGIMKAASPQFTYPQDLILQPLILMHLGCIHPQSRDRSQR